MNTTEVIDLTDEVEVIELYDVDLEIVEEVEQVKAATAAALELWRIGRCKLALWNPETGDRTHLD